MPTRRVFLKQTIAGSFFLLGASPLVRPFNDPAPPESLKYFSEKEFLIFKAVAGQVIGIDANSPLTETEIALRADEFLSAADPDEQDQFHTLLYAFNAPIFTFLFDLRFSSFIGMSAEDRQSYLEDWMTSNFAFRRTGFQALKRVSLSMYYTDSKSWPGIGYEGMFLPWERS